MTPTTTPVVPTPSPIAGEGVTLDDILQAAHACLLDRESEVRRHGCALIGDVAALVLAEPEIPDAAYTALIAAAGRITPGSWRSSWPPGSASGWPGPGRAAEPWSGNSSGASAARGCARSARPARRGQR